MKPGRFWFSVPRPYVTHEPRLGRIISESPQFISINEGSWLGSSVCIERMTQRSSAHAPTWGNSSLTSSPLCPYLRNRNGEGKAAPVLRSVRGFPPGKDLPAYL